MGDILESIKNRSNEQLLDDIGLGKDSYRDDIFELYLNEAQDRGLDVSLEKLPQINENKKTKLIEQEAKRQLVIGIILLLFVMGLFAFIPGRILLKKDDEGNYYYKGKYKKFAKFISIWSLAMWTFIILGLIIFFLWK